MSWVLIGVAAFLAYRLVSKKSDAPAGTAAPTATPPTVAPESFETGIETRARLKELDLVAEAQAKINLQRRFDLIAKAQKSANPEESGPKSP